MLAFFRSAMVALVVTGVLAASRALAANEGQEDLDKATVAKLNADSLSDLAEVIRLIESALHKGLDEANTRFANQLLASTRIQRGTVIAQAILNTIPPDPNWREFRRVALDDLEKGVALEFNQPQALLTIAQLNLLPDGDASRAASALDDAIRRADKEPLVKAKALLLRAGLTKDPAKKQADLDEAVRTAPGSAAALRARGSWYFDQDKFHEALADFDAALKLESHSASLRTARALTLIELKRYDEALAELAQARHLEPNAVAPLYEQGRVLGIQGKFKEALEPLEKAAALDPGNVGVLLLRATVYQELDEKDKALADVDRALKLRPGLAVAMQLRAALLAGSNKFSEAIAQLEELQRVTPEDPDVELQLAMFYSVEGKPRKAIERFTKVLAKEPDNFIALRGRADALLSIGRQAEAIADYEKALKKKPDDSGVLNNLAWVLATSPDEKLRNGKRSIELATKACELTEYKQAHILSTLAAGYAEIGDFQTAIKWSQKAVELGKPDQKEALAKELAGYKDGKPFRELQNTPEAEEPSLPTLPPQEKDQPSPKGEEGPLLPPKPAEPKGQAPGPAPAKPDWPNLDEPPEPPKPPAEPKA